MLDDKQKEKRQRRLKFLEEFLPAAEHTLSLADSAFVSVRLRQALLFEVDSMRSEKAQLENILKGEPRR